MRKKPELEEDNYDGFCSHHYNNSCTCKIKCCDDMKAKTHGGKRKGSGRPKLKDSEKKEPTKVMRIPKSKVDEVTIIIKK